MNEPWKRTRKERFPLPSRLIGLSLTPWPGPGSPAICPACGSKRLNSQMYCLYCDRWGRDPEATSTGPIRDSGRPRGFFNPEKQANVDQAATEKARADRKAKHQRRMEEQANAERQKKARAKKAADGQPPRNSVGD